MGYSCIVKYGMQSHYESVRRWYITKGGPLYNGEVGHFENAGSSGSYDSKRKDEVNEDAAEMAQQAVSAMEEAEKATGKRVMDLF